MRKIFLFLYFCSVFYAIDSFEDFALGQRHRGLPLEYSYTMKFARASTASGALLGSSGVRSDKDVLEEKIRNFLQNYYPEDYMDVMKISLGDPVKFSAAIAGLDKIHVGTKDGEIASAVAPLSLLGETFGGSELNIQKDIREFTEWGEIKTLWHECIHLIEYQNGDHLKSKPSYSQGTEEEFEERHGSYFESLVNSIYDVGLNLVHKKGAGLPEYMKNQFLKTFVQMVRERKIESNTYEGNRDLFYRGYSEEQYLDDLKEFREQSGIWLHFADLYEN